jgi:CDP-paratose 2-epimerase
VKVLVTGGCGFIGSHVCEYYIKKGAEVISYDNMTKYELMRTGYNTEIARRYNWLFLKKLGVNLLKKDVRNYSDLERAAQGCDFIVHTAAQPAVTISKEDPKLDFATNAMGTFHVLEVARKVKIPIVSCATIHVYGNKINESLTEGKTRYLRDPESINEQCPAVEGRLTPLHASKMAGDLYVQTYIDTYGLEAASFRLTGLYGPRQLGGEDHGWVANFAIKLILDGPINIYGTGKQVRDILYVTDVAEAFDAFFKAKKSGIYNIGGGPETSISLIECLELLKELAGKGPRINFRPERFGDLRYFVCDTTKAQRDLKWKAKTLPREGITHLVEWIERNIQLFRRD